MAEWLRLASSAPPDSTNEEPDFVVGVVLSPYDVPEAVRGFRTSTGRFRIEFRYIDGDEPGKDLAVNPHLIAIQGRHSGRLLAMELDTAAIGADSVGLTISTAAPCEIKHSLDTAWDQLAKTLGHSREKVAFAAKARRAVATRERDLLCQLAST